jgi:serpin B
MAGHSRKLGAVWGAAFVLFVSCGPQGGAAHHASGTGAAPPSAPAPSPRPSAAPALPSPEAADAGTVPAQAEAPPEPVVPATLADSINLFARDLHREIAKKPGNLFYSPLSISIALTMASAGARGQTAEEMAKVLHLGSEARGTHGEYAKLIASLSSEPRAGAPDVRIANRLWVELKSELVPEFAALTSEHYRAPVEKLDFINQPEPSRGIINRWVEQKTKERIKDLIPRDGVTSDDRVVLTNAIYFKGLWAKPFKKTDTRGEVFYDHGTTARKVPMMHALLRARYAETDDAQVLELPYSRGGGPELALVLIVPKDRKGLPAVERHYGREGIGAFVRDLQQAEVRLALPRFKMTVPVGLKRILGQLGMVLAFTNRADFSAMVDQAVKIKEVYHKAFVQLDEEGTEAAAATAVVMGRVSAGPPPRELSADHPFLFVIRDVKSGATLFGGRIVAPK